MTDAPQDSPPKKSFWDQPVKRRLVVRGRPYTIFVRWMRLVLPLAAAAVVGALIAWPDVEDALVAPPPPVAGPQAIAGTNELVGPRFESRDRAQRPFVVTADRAVQSAADPGLAVLEQPRAELSFADGGALRAEAAQGSWRQNEENLLLEGDVKIFHSSGYEMITEKMLVNMKGRTLWSDQPVAGKGPAGTLAATGLQADEAAGVLVLTGPAKLVLNESIKGL